MTENRYFSNFHFPGVTLRYCNTYQDDRGALTMLLDEAGKVARAYVMITKSGLGRDLDTWHVHRKQHDRFYVLKGKVAFAFSNGEKSVVLMMHEADGYLITVEPGIYHCFKSFSNSWVINFPDKHYDRADELRVPFEGLGVEVPW
jgi:dTDP-4-dehydrorhamnose 3,5-epimerase-like enzyme